MFTNINNYENRIVCFMDILAFKELIKSTIKDDAEVLDRTELIKSLFQIMISELENKGLKIELENGVSDDVVKVTHFSDSIVLSVSLREESALFNTLNLLQFFLLELLRYKIFIRGGIAIGKLYHDGNTIFGPALNKAYFLENKIAKYPRVIIDLDTIEFYLKNNQIRHNLKTEKEYIFSLLSFDTDGYGFIDYFDVDFTQFDSNSDGIYYMRYLRDLIIQNIKEHDSEEGVRSKNNWLIKKFNSMIVSKNKEFHIKFQAKYDIRKIERKRLRGNVK